MPEDVLVKVPSYRLNKALRLNSYDGTPTSYLLNLTAEPIDASVAPTAGQNYIPGNSWAIGKGGDHSPNRIFLQPYCEGPEGSLFWMRLYGLRPLGLSQNQDLVWVSTLLIQLACVAGNLPGPTVASGTALIQTENTCDSLTVVTGWVGMTGEVVSAGPGSQFGAFALVELRGCKKVVFEFEQFDNVGMNALWAPC